MASINIEGDDFSVLAEAAYRAREAGDQESSEALDRLARKANAALSNEELRKRLGGTLSPRVRLPLSWEDVPSVFEPAIETRTRIAARKLAQQMLEKPQSQDGVQAKMEPDPDREEACFSRTCCLQSPCIYGGQPE